MVNISLVPIITYLSEKPYAIHALSILHEVAHRVESIMLKRGYKIGALREFYPESRLLGTFPPPAPQKIINTININPHMDLTNPPED